MGGSYHWTIFQTLDTVAIDSLDKLSDNWIMSKNNAPPKWDEIKTAAKACGAGDWAMRKWLERKRIPADWKIKILEKARGRVKLADMEITGQAEAPR
jgi:translation initiation factor 2 alpha subunit (eIF-2alpha)